MHTSGRHALRVSATLIVAVAGVAGCGGHAHAAPGCASVLGPLKPVTEKGASVATGPSLTIDAANSAFAPTCVTDVPRGFVSVTFRNTGVVIHNVEITAQHIDTDIAPRHSVTIRIRVDADPVVYVCRYHRALGMVGVLIPAPASH